MGKVSKKVDIENFQITFSGDRTLNGKFHYFWQWNFLIINVILHTVRNDVINEKKLSLPDAMAFFNLLMNPKIHHLQCNLNTENEITINDQLLIRIKKDKNKMDEKYSPTPGRLT